MKKRVIYLVRHGSINTGGSKRFIGQAELPLNAEGIRQAEYLQRKLAGANLTEIYCSDLSRSRQTADIIAAVHSIQLSVCSGLREISLGEWEGLSFSEIEKKYPGEFERRGADIAGYRPPGGESFADLSTRVINEFYRILNHSSGNILLVGHAGVNRVIICHLLGMPLKNIFKICQNYGCLNVIYQDNSSFQINLINHIELSL
ncbi:alpha-ribazole phosphatase [Desulfolucanica intricata]|uniref:alpha-ribazole phosphatase n=1 Tax=Desulfolucanica intricata TaxID=1285191 RepID=UPI00082D9D6D|nr:alpha-ribazole phosphatase [Desulfolucanica intricata]